MTSALDRKTIVLAVVLSASPLAAVKADLLRYEFAGAVGYSPNGTVPVGTPIRGRWEVLIPQAGAEYVESRWEATLYNWQVFDIEIAGEMLEAKGKDLDGFHGIFVSTAETPRTQTGYTTYYQARIHNVTATSGNTPFSVREASWDILDFSQPARRGKGP